MGRKYPRDGIVRIFPWTDLQGVAQLGGVVLVKPVENRDVGKTVQPQKRRFVGFLNFNPGVLVRMMNDPHGECLV
jgi:hypothetical protein